MSSINLSHLRDLTQGEIFTCVWETLNVNDNASHRSSSFCNDYAAYKILKVFRILPSALGFLVHRWLFHVRNPLRLQHRVSRGTGQKQTLGILVWSDRAGCKRRRVRRISRIPSSNHPWLYDKWGCRLSDWSFPQFEVALGCYRSSWWHESSKWRLSWFHVLSNMWNNWAPLKYLFSLVPSWHSLRN